MCTPKQLKEKMELGLDTILNKFVEENYFKLEEGVLFYCDCSEKPYVSSTFFHNINQTCGLLSAYNIN
jgi:hypothetical protein